MKVEHSGDMRKIFLSLLSGGRPDNHGFDQGLVAQEAQELYDAGQGKIGTGESSLFLSSLVSNLFNNC
jgi:hypothetical protein